VEEQSETQDVQMPLRQALTGDFALSSNACGWVKNTKLQHPTSGYYTKFFMMSLLPGLKIPS
jgi:hypothetical protein